MIMKDEMLEKTIAEIKNADYIALDFETISLEDLTPVACSIAYGDTVLFIPIRMKYFFNVSETTLTNVLKTLVQQNNIIFHNASFDIQVLRKMGFRFSEAPHDTLLLSHLVNENGSHKLKDLIDEHFKYSMIRYKEICGTGKKQITFADVSDKVLAEKYASEDAEYTLKLFKKLLTLISNNAMKAYTDIERPLILVVDEMHEFGLPVDINKLKGIEEQCKQLQAFYKSKLEYYMSDVNLNSSKQLKDYFIGKKGNQVMKRSKKTNAPSIDSEVLKKYADKKVQEADWILKYRFYSKILSTFIPALTPDGEGNIHSSFHQVGTSSGRFSSSHPNFQNIPKAKDDKLGIRSCIKVPKGYKLVGFDYSAIEMRLTAHFSDEKLLLDAFNNGVDVHASVAKSVGCTRDQAKTLSYATLYGAGVNVIAKNMQTDRVTATQFLHNFKMKYQNIESMIRDLKLEITGKGKIDMLYGRERHLPLFFDDLTEWEKGCVLRSIVNAKIQGSAAMLMKHAMLCIYESIRHLDAHVIGSIHDEIICLSSDKDAEEVARIMKSCMEREGEGLKVKLTVDGGIGNDWSQLH
jgi:DNA polymerase-1